MAANANKSYIAGIGLKGSSGAVIEDNIPIVVDYRNVIVDFGASTKRLDDILFGAYDKDGHQIGLYTSMGEEGKDNPLFDPQKNSFFQYWKNQKDRWEQLIVKYENEWEPFKIDRTNNYVKVKANDGTDGSGNAKALNDWHYCLEIGRRPNPDGYCLFNIGTANNSSHTQSGMWYRMDQLTDDTGNLGLRSLSNDSTDNVGKLGAGRSTLRFHNGGGFGSGQWPNHFFAVWAQDATNPANTAMAPYIDKELYVGTQDRKFKEMNSIKLNIGEKPSESVASTGGIEVWEGGVHVMRGGLSFGDAKNPMMIDLQKDTSYDGQPNHMNYRVSFVEHGVTINTGGLAIKHNGLRIFNDSGITVDAGGIRVENDGLWVKRGGISFGGNQERMLDIYDDSWYSTGSHVMRYRLGFSRGVTINQGGLAIKENGARIRGGLHLETGGIVLGGLGNPMMIDLQKDGAYDGLASHMQYRVSFLHQGVTIDKGGLAIKNDGLRIFEGDLIIQRGGLKFGHPNNEMMIDLKNDTDYETIESMRYRICFSRGVTIEDKGLAIKHNGIRVFNDSGITVDAGGVHVKAGGINIAQGGLWVQKNGISFGSSSPTQERMIDLYDDDQYQHLASHMQYRIGFSRGVTIDKGGLAIKNDGLRIFNGGLHINAGGLRFGGPNNDMMLDLQHDNAYRGRGNPFEYRTTFTNYGVTIQKGGLAIKEHGLRIFNGDIDNCIMLGPVHIWYDDRYGGELKFEKDGKAFSINFKEMKTSFVQ